MLATQKKFCFGHPALEQAFAQLGLDEGLPVEQAAAVLAFLLKGVRDSSWHEVAWRSSALTSTGFPVELAFASHGQEVRYTCEIAGAEVPACKRLPIALDLMRQLTGQSVQSAMPGWLLAAQEGESLQYGAWISGRHAVAGDRYKLYVEVASDEPAALQAVIQQRLGQRYLLSERKSTLRMVGIEPATGRTELYFRIHHLELHQLYSLLAHADCRPQAAMLVDFIQQERRWFDPQRLPGNFTGVSYTFTPNTKVPTCTIFLPAGKLWGSDVVIRERLAQLIAEHGWQMKDYLMLSAKLPLATQGRHRHGLVGLSVLPNGELGVGIGVSVG